VGKNKTPNRVHLTHSQNQNRKIPKRRYKMHNKVLEELVEKYESLGYSYEEASELAYKEFISGVVDHNGQYDY